MPEPSNPATEGADSGRGRRVPRTRDYLLLRDATDSRLADLDRDRAVLLGTLPSRHELWTYYLGQLVNFAEPQVRNVLTGKRRIPELPFPRAGLGLTDQEHRDLRSIDLERTLLAYQILTDGSLLFQRKIRAGVWDPQRGRTLPFYFVNSCWLSVPNAVRRWRTERGHYVLPLEVDQLTSSHDERVATQRDADAEMRDLLRVRLVRLRGGDDRHLRAVQLHVDEHRSWDDAALEAGLEPAQLRAWLRRARRERRQLTQPLPPARPKDTPTPVDPQEHS